MICFTKGYLLEINKLGADIGYITRHILHSGLRVIAGHILATIYPIYHEEMGVLINYFGLQAKGIHIDIDRYFAMISSYVPDMSNTKDLFCHSVGYRDYCSSILYLATFFKHKTKQKYILRNIIRTPLSTVDLIPFYEIIDSSYISQLLASIGHSIRELDLRGYQRITKGLVDEILFFCSQLELLHISAGSLWIPINNS